MYCKKVEEGKSVSDYNGRQFEVDGEVFTFRDGVLFDEDGMDVAIFPNGYIPTGLTSE